MFYKSKNAPDSSHKALRDALDEFGRVCSRSAEVAEVARALRDFRLSLRQYVDAKQNPAIT